MLANRYKNDQYWYMKEYVKVPYHQHIQWTQDWLRDHYRFEHNQTLVPTPNDSIRGIIQQTGENVNTHHNVQELAFRRITRSILFIYGVNWP